MVELAPEKAILSQLFWGTSYRILPSWLSLVPGEYRICMKMVNVTVMIQNQRKCILRYTCDKLFDLYSPGGGYTYSTHSKS